MKRALWTLCICGLSELALAKTVLVAECLPQPIQPIQGGAIYSPKARITGANDSVIITHQHRSEIYYSAAYLNPTDTNLAVTNIRELLIPENYRDLEFVVKKTSNAQCQWLIGRIFLGKL